VPAAGNGGKKLGEESCHVETSMTARIDGYFYEVFLGQVVVNPSAASFKELGIQDDDLRILCHWYEERWDTPSLDSWMRTLWKKRGGTAPRGTPDYAFSPLVRVLEHDLEKLISDIRNGNVKDPGICIPLAREAIRSGSDVFYHGWL
jgi:hypothetical protein